MCDSRFDLLRFVRDLINLAVGPLVATAYVLIVLPLIYDYQGVAKLLCAQYRLRTLAILTAVAPPLLWGLYVLLRPPERLFWAGCFLASLVICAPVAMLRLNVFRFKL
jgi:hypothetical protein